MGFGFSHIINPLTAGVDGITLHSDRKPTLNGPGLYFGGATLTGVTPSPPLGQAGSIYANNAVSSAMTGVSSWSTNMLQLPGSPYYTSPLSITTSVPVNKGDLVIACQGCSDSHWDWQRPIIPGAYTWQQPQETNMPVGPPGWTDLGHMRRYYANTSAGGGWTSGGIWFQFMVPTATRTITYEPWYGQEDPGAPTNYWIMALGATAGGRHGLSMLV